MRITVVTLCLASCLLALGCNKPAETGPASTGPLTTDHDKTLYALGQVLGRDISFFGLTKEELAVVQRGLVDAATGAKSEVEMETWGPKVNELARARKTARAEQEKTRAKEYLDKAAAEKGAERTASGLIYTELTAGTGAQPTAADTVKVHYRGTLVDGTEFDSSYKRGQPAEFPLGGVIKCWTEGVAKMKVGGKARLVCPSDIAYGDRGSPPTIPGGATLIFEVELLDVKAKG
ncbi:MAG: FKBP-type peptidyl-prolyl cis-trans isomerase [Myxococcota bacterium]